MNDKGPAEAFPPGLFIKRGLDARGWTQTDLAEVLGRPVRLVNEAIQGKRGITPETAKGLAIAFGTSAQYWLNLESSYQLWKARQASTDDAVARRALLFMKAPIRDMLRRGWIEPSENLGVLERHVMDFLRISDLSATPKFWAYAARKSTSYDKETPAQTAWLFRARQLGEAAPAKAFSKAKLDDLVTSLQTLLHDPNEVRRVPTLVAEAGIRFVVIEALPHTRIDGVCFWIDEQPVIALSMRYDRIDYFWFTLMHELGHVRNKDGLNNSRGHLDSDLFREAAPSRSENPKAEVLADQFAVETLLDQAALTDFIVRTQPLFSSARIQRFANRIGVHPGIVVGQLQYKEKISYAHHRRMLVPVRHIIMGAALTDGWGHIISTSL